MPSSSLREGSTSEQDLTALLVDVFVNRLSGTMIVSRDAAARTLEWQDGRIVAAASTHPDDDLAALLLREGRITLAQWAGLHRADPAGRHVADALVSAGLLSAEELSAALTEQAELVVQAALRWLDPQSWFQPGSTPPGAARVRRTTPELVMAAIHGIDSWRQVAAAVGEPDTRYARADHFEELLAELPLSFERLSVLTDLHGVKDVASICADSSLPDFQVCQLLWAYRVLGAVRRLDRPVWARPEIEDEGLDAVLSDEAAEVEAAPAVASAAPPLPDAPPLPAAVAEVAGTRRILLVGLAEELASSIDPMLNRATFTVERLASATEALTLASHRGCDLLLTSNPPPDMALRELLERIRLDRSARHVVVAAEESDVSELRRSLGPSAEVAVLLKDPRRLLEEVASRLLGVPRRVSARLLVRLEIKLENQRRLVMYQTENLSSTGLLVRTDQLLPIGTRTNLEFQLPNDRHPVLGSAEVVRHTLADVEKLHGMGLRFVGFRADGQKRLEEFLARQGPDS